MPYFMFTVPRLNRIATYHLQNKRFQFVAADVPFTIPVNLSTAEQRDQPYLHHLYSPTAWILNWRHCSLTQTWKLGTPGGVVTWRRRQENEGVNEDQALLGQRTTGPAIPSPRGPGKSPWSGGSESRIKELKERLSSVKSVEDELNKELSRLEEGAARTLQSTYRHCQV